MPNQGGTTKRMKPSSLTVTGGGGFFYLSLPNKLPAAFSVVLPMVLPVERRVWKRRDRVAETGGLRENSDGRVKEDKPWIG